MGTSQIRKSIEEAIAYLTDNPDEARYRDSPATAAIDGLKVTVSGTGEHESATTDMPEGVGGGGSAPSPGWLFRAAVASCVASLISMKAAIEDIELTTLAVIVDSESDDRGILGIDDSLPAGPISLRVHVEIGADDVEQDRLRQLVDWGYRHCPVSEAVSRAIPEEIQIEVV